MTSLRFRLPLIFLAGVLLASAVTGVLALRLLQDYAHDRIVTDLRRQAAGLASLYREQARQGVDEGRRAPRFARPRLESVTDTRLYYAGVPIFPGQESGLRRLPVSYLDREALDAGEVLTFELTPPDTDRRHLAVAQPIEFGGSTFGALVVAKPTADLRELWGVLLGRLGIALVAGLGIAALLFLYLSRRITRPVLALSAATDRVAEGRYDVKLPRSRRRDEIAHLTDRFQEMAVRLAEAEALERQFLMTVSHELRTPLTAIRGHVEALREGLAEDPEARAASLEVVRAEADRLERLVGDLLDLAKLDARRFTLTEDEVALDRLVERAYLARAEEARQRRIDYDRIGDTAPVIHTDGDRVLQIVSNLLDNAFAWTPDGGRITLALAQANGAVRVSVQDTGPGIPEAERERIFRPFYSGDESAGTGLGLAIARELANALGGRLELDSRVGKGSRFDLVLPAR
ncbi:MAG TPA: ATP-binding protein [Gaiellaceae bacterium]|nr:ATP-binding protein [Gaiellaceae bacterium]